jgi:hypothetical protein
MMTILELQAYVNLSHKFYDHLLAQGLPENYEYCEAVASAGAFGSSVLENAKKEVERNEQHTHMDSNQSESGESVGADRPDQECA